MIALTDRSALIRSTLRVALFPDGLRATRWAPRDIGRAFAMSDRLPTQKENGKTL